MRISGHLGIIFRESRLKDECIIPQDNGWAVKSRSAKQPSDVFQTKKEAVDRASKITKNKGSNVIIHRKMAVSRKISNPKARPLRIYQSWQCPQSRHCPNS
ncbi:MAG: DUF2188 domain-containing protein [Sporolactobacillus sp.]